MKILILGGDGYLGWPSAMYFSSRGNEVAVLDNFAKRRWELESGIEPLIPISTLHQRVKIWEEITKRKIQLFIGDLRNFEVVEDVLRKFKPDAIIHYGEQPSAPYSMLDHNRAVFTQVNNISGTLNLLFAIKKVCPDCHLIKLGTMGEYGTPNIDIEEGFIEFEHNGRKDVLPFPKQPGSFYHLSKVHDSHNIMFACKVWGLRSTDLNQGVVYGIETAETCLDERLMTSFHYDEVFGTVLNRFCVQAVIGEPLTIYGEGEQIRSFLNIRDTIQCVELAMLSKPEAFEYRVFNQFTEVFKIKQLANLIKDECRKIGLEVVIKYLDNPRIEQERHYYNAVNTRLVDLGLKPTLLSGEIIDKMIKVIQKYKENIKQEIILPKIKWN